MKTRKLGHSGLAVSAIGLGCMGMSEFYGPTNEAESLMTIGRALELGVTFFDTADTYGSGHNESLVGRAVRAVRDRIVIATKFGIVRKPGEYTRTISGRPDYVRQACDASLGRLGVDVIDLYYQHRVDPRTPIEDTVGAMARLVEEGKVVALGLSEVGPETLRRAHAVHPIAAVQSEYSLWTRDAEEGVIPVCRELGVAFVAYSPIGRGFLSGRITSKDDLAADDFRRTLPRLQDENIDANRALVDELEGLAARKDCTPAQLALAWLLHQGDDVVPIPGTRRVAYVEQNVAAAEIDLTAEELRAIDLALPPGSAVGPRYTAEGMKGIDA